MSFLKQSVGNRLSHWLRMLLLCLFVPRIFADVSISGINDEARDNVKLMLHLQQEKCDAPKWKIQGLFDNADQEIDQALRALGYYHVALKKSLAFNLNCWQADFDISPEPRVLVDKVDIVIDGDAKGDPDFARLLKKLPLKPGSPLHHGQYESMKSRIESLALESGYLQGSFTQKNLLIDKQSNTAQIKLTFDSGKRMVFGDITVQRDVLDEGFVDKFLTIKSGDTYTSEQLAKTHNALSQSGYFDMVDIRSDLEHAQDQRVPVTIKLTAKKKAHYGLGLGFDTDIGPLLNANYINRRINQYGHFFTANFDLSPVLSTAEVEYSIPLDKPMTDLFSFGGGLKREDTKTFEALSATLSARHKHVYTNGWRQTLFLDYSYEDFTTDSDSGQRLLLVPGGSWLRSVSNDPLRPTEGYRIEFETKGSVENPVSDASFLQAYLSGVWLHEVPWGGLIIGRTLQGATLVDQITQLPTSYRLYAGGINSVRGYNYKELGPRDTSGNVEGGKFLSVASAEYEQAVLEDWGVAAFLDTGNAFNLDDIRFKTGVGLGVRWYSPVGALRLDFALPLNESDSSFQIHFAAGGRL
jgi:translocation and assembly module TamA